MSVFYIFVSFIHLTFAENCKIARQSSLPYLTQMTDNKMQNPSKNDTKMKRQFLWMVMMAIGLNTSAQTTNEVNDSIQLDSLTLHELHEVVIKGRLPNTRLKGDAMVTRITGSTLEKAGTAEDVLRRVPGMIRKGEDLEVIGRGKPIYYINGRRVYDEDELKRLLSDEIANVEVITNPGAMYDATVSAVVRIKTVRRQGDGLSLNAFAKTEQSLRTGLNDPECQVSANYRFKNFDIFASAKEWQYRTNQWSDLGETTYDKTTGAPIFNYDGTMKHQWRGIGTHLNAGFNWQIDDKHSLGAKIDYAVQTKADTNERLYMEKRERGTLVETVNSDGQNWSDNPDNISVNAYYNGNIGKLNIDFNTDLFISNDNTHQLMQETATTTDRNVVSLTTSKNNMWASKLVLTYPIWKGSLNVGTEETFVSRDNTNEMEGADLPNSSSKVKDNTYAAFIQYGVAFSRNTQASIGLRFEHVSFEYEDLSDPTGNLSRNYNNLFPSASFSTVLGKVRMMLAFSSKTQRPSFWQLNNSMMYHNRYVVQQGSPTLKPSIENTVSLTTMFSIFTLGASYSHYSDLISNWSEQMNEEGLIRVSYKNLDKPQKQINLFGVATKTWGCYTPSVTVAFVKQWLTLDFDNGSRSFNKPMWVFNANNAFRLKHNWQLELNSEFHSKANYSNVELTSNFWSLNASIQKSLLKNNALTLRLSCNDIFKRGNNNVFIDYGSFNIYQTNIMDYHRVVFSARYSFNATRSKYKGTGAGQDVKSRLGVQNGK